MTLPMPNNVVDRYISIEGIYPPGRIGCTLCTEYEDGETYYEWFGEIELEAYLDACSSFGIEPKESVVNHVNEMKKHLEAISQMEH